MMYDFLFVPALLILAAMCFMVWRHDKPRQKLEARTSRQLNTQMSALIASSPGWDRIPEVREWKTRHL